MKCDMDELLQQALSPSEEPMLWLNEKILQEYKENEHMKKRRRNFPLGAAAAALILMIASVGVFAGWKYLAPENVAETVFEDELLSKAFQTENAILVNETQECGEYRITLMGIVSGKGLSEYTQWDEQGNIVDDRTYIVTAIENTDGTPRPDVSDDDYGQDSFYVSPYIKGLSMVDYNAHTLGGGYSEDVVDGIQYRLLECDNIEMFAARGIYLGVNEGFSCDVQAYHMDEETGEIIRNEDYEGVNALFELPIPAFKGDEAAVQAYIDQMEAEQTDDEEQAAELSGGLEQVVQETEGWTLEDFQSNAECVYEEELVLDEKESVSYHYELEGGRESETIQYQISHLYEGKDTSFAIGGFYGSDNICVETFELLESGNVMLRVFMMQ